MSEYKNKYWFINDGNLYLTRCPRCKLENWAVAVASGKCAWCGYAPNMAKIKRGEEGRGDV